jgi:alkylated DNA repair dioxygenase AlkB
MTASQTTAPSLAMRAASHAGTRPLCRGRSALPLRRVMFTESDSRSARSLPGVVSADTQALPERGPGEGVPTHMSQPDFFGEPERFPSGFRYTEGLITAREEQSLIREIAGLPFKEFEFHGFLGKRRVVSFGWRYDFNHGGLQKTVDIPDCLLPVRERAASFAGLAAAELQQVLLTEYRPGAAIGWHKDRWVFGEIVGVSLCTFRLRRKVNERWERMSLELQPRSAYLLQGPVRTGWEHGMPAVSRLRYSITFRNIIIERDRRRR